jgi:hypothetical protein
VQVRGSPLILLKTDHPNATEVKIRGRSIIMNRRTFANFVMAAPWYAPPQALDRPGAIVIVGAGVIGASIAYPPAGSDQGSLSEES